MAGVTVATRRLRVVVLMGGTSSEREVSLRSGTCAAAALDRDRYEAIPVSIAADGAWLLPPGAAGGLPGPAAPAGAGPAPLVATDPVAAGALRGVGEVDVVLLALHGRAGEDGTVQALLETAGLAYTGSAVLASALCMDKARARDVAARAGLRVASGRVVERGEWRRDRERVLDGLEAVPGLPAFVKPPGGGSSLGAGPADTRAGLAARIDDVLRDHEDRALVERRLVGTEVSCPAIGNRGGPVEALPVVEIVPRGREFFDYVAKYEPGACDEICPARIPPAQERAVREAAVLAHRAMGCDGLSRSDFILVEGEPWYLETNTIPGMTEGSLCPRSARAAGIPFPALVDRMLELALARRAPSAGATAPERSPHGR